MDKFWDNIPSFLTFLGVWVAAVYGPKAIAKMQGKEKKEVVRAEGDSKAEELYLAATERQYDRYEAEILRIEANFNKRIKEIEKDFDKKFEEINKKNNHLLEEKSFLEKELEARDDRIDDLELENTTLRIENVKLKGGM